MERLNIKEESLAIAWIENISVLDTSASKYKKIRRLSNQPHYLVEDTSP